MRGEWAIVAAAGALSVAIRLAPEAWLRGRAPPPALAAALPWVPVAVAGALTGALHLGAADTRLGYVLAAIPAAATLLWRRSFYLPLVVGAASLALLRKGGLV